MSHSIGEIFKAGIKALGYDGLANPECGCGCGVDDLNPCDGLEELHCQGGYKRTDHPEYGEWYSTEKDGDGTYEQAGA